jgi:hypothetical protein
MVAEKLLRYLPSRIARLWVSTPSHLLPPLAFLLPPPPPPPPLLLLLLLCRCR